MKVTLDLTRLLEQGKISQAEFDKLGALSAQDTGSLAFNILIGFGLCLWTFNRRAEAIAR